MPPQVNPHSILLLLLNSHLCAVCWMGCREEEKGKEVGVIMKVIRNKNYPKVCVHPTQTVDKKGNGDGV